ncbi:MAG: NAD-dependent epimerase/dehydratase family protein [Deltaproteobacteria bacterium]|nr:NAD-dependent epimerase/dehydratase family protein [Deltaproteobacteria bacterium]
MITAASTPRVLVTGGAGFIGSWLVEALLAAGFSVRVLDDLSTGRRENLPDSVELIVGDVLDAEALEGACAGMDGVFHLAGVVGMRLAHTHKNYSYRVAVESTERLLGFFDGPVVLASSSAVYGLTDDTAVAEDFPITDDSVRRYDGDEVGYALGKWHMEDRALRAVAKGHKVMVLRPFNVVGPRQTGTYGMVVPTFVKLALAGAPLVIHDDGLQTRCFGHVRTFVDAVLGLAANPASWVPGQNVVNIGNDQPVSILELARVVGEEVGTELHLEFVPYGEVFPGRRDVRDRRPDSRRLEQLLGRAPSWPDMSEVVRDILADLRASGEDRSL